MRDSFSYEENSCLSAISSRSTSPNRTLTSSSSNGDLSDDSRSPSPLQQNDENELNQNGKRVAEKLASSSPKKLKHSTPVSIQQNNSIQKNFLHDSSNRILSITSMIQHSPISNQRKQEIYSAPSQKIFSLCAVCGDRASGKHYGVLSCDGCRGFFKRSIRGNMEYVCKENQKCIIDVSRRNQCQACRLKKCLDVKMNRDAVQHQRPPRSQMRAAAASATTNSTPSSQPSSSIQATHPSTPNSFYAHQSRFAPYPNLSPFHQSLPFSSPFSVPFLPHPTSFFNPLTRLAPPPTAPQSSLFLLNSPNVSNATSSSGYCTSTSSDDSSIIENEIKDTKPTVNENVYEIATKVLFSSVKWSRLQRPFMSLACPDQAVLLENCWTDLFILTAAETKMQFQASQFTALGDQLELKKKDINDLQDTIHALVAARLDPMELYLLKSIILFKGELKGIQDKAKVEAIQEEYLHSLNVYASKLGPNRFGKLLLLLSNTRRFSSKLIEDLFFKHILGTNSIDNLLIEILKNC